MPTKSLHELSNSIHYVMDNAHLTISDVRDILRGGRRDVPLTKIQMIGRLLIEGKSLRHTAKEVGVSYETVSRIESFVGIQEARRLKLVDFACDAIREGWSVRAFASAAGIPKSTAHLMLVRAKQVLQELGESNE
jgi:lambda repressor-like predicted transcriptional regulator